MKEYIISLISDKETLVTLYFSNDTSISFSKSENQVYTSDDAIILNRKGKDYIINLNQVLYATKSTKATDRRSAQTIF